MSSNEESVLGMTEKQWLSYVFSVALICTSLFMGKMGLSDLLMKRQLEGGNALALIICITFFAVGCYIAALEWKKAKT